MVIYASPYKEEVRESAALLSEIDCILTARALPEEEQPALSLLTKAADNTLLVIQRLAAMKILELAELDAELQSVPPRQRHAMVNMIYWRARGRP